MAIEISHFITIDSTRVKLSPKEAKYVIHGEIPRYLAEKLTAQGFRVPKRGTVPFHLEGWENGSVVFKSQAYMRRVPMLPRQVAA